MLLSRRAEHGSVSAKCAASAPLSVGTRGKTQSHDGRTNAQFVSAQETISIHVQALERCFLRRRKTAARVTAAVRARAAGGKT